MRFKSDLQAVKDIPIPESLDVRTLPQLFRSDANFVRSLRNPFLNALLEELPKHPEHRYLSIDSRTHMLFRGVYPNIPGWHCDDFYRTEANGNQPDLLNLEREANSVHYMLLIGDASLTEFLVDDIELPSCREILALGTNKPIYYHHDMLIEERAPRTVSLVPGRLYRFGPLCFHRGQEATKNGWRYFIRLTYSNHYVPRNELRYQTQVYTRERVSW